LFKQKQGGGKQDERIFKNTCSGIRHIIGDSRRSGNFHSDKKKSLKKARKKGRMALFLFFLKRVTIIA